MVEKGKKAPTFALASDAGETVALEDFIGRHVVLYFYPKDATPGWTQEAKDFRDEIDQFTKANSVVLGVSRDSVRSHQRFKTAQEIPFTLLSDPDGAVCKMYGVLKEKKMFGKIGFGIERSTFLIDKKGVVREIYRGVKVAEHVEAVLQAVRAL